VKRSGDSQRASIIIIALFTKNDTISVVVLRKTYSRVTNKKPKNLVVTQFKIYRTNAEKQKTTSLSRSRLMINLKILYLRQVTSQ